jgi:hypothetical protein
MADMATKILLTVIALGLWANFAAGVMRPSIAIAQDTDLSATESALSSIQNDLDGMERGICRNRKLC